MPAHAPPAGASDSEILKAEVLIEADELAVAGQKQKRAAPSPLSFDVALHELAAKAVMPILGADIQTEEEDGLSPWIVERGIREILIPEALLLCGESREKACDFPIDPIIGDEKGLRGGLHAFRHMFSLAGFVFRKTEELDFCGLIDLGRSHIAEFKTIKIKHRNPPFLAAVSGFNLGSYDYSIAEKAFK